jgi:hypothetical protein
MVWELTGEADISIKAAQPAAAADARMVFKRACKERIFVSSPRILF